jgi:hypothetical protein
MSELPCMVRLIDRKLDAYTADGKEAKYTGSVARKATFHIGDTGANEHQKYVTKREFDEAMAQRSKSRRKRA